MYETFADDWPSAGFGFCTGFLALIFGVIHNAVMDEAQLFVQQVAHQNRLNRFTRDESTPVYLRRTLRHQSAPRSSTLHIKVGDLLPLREHAVLNRTPQTSNASTITHTLHRLIEKLPCTTFCGLTLRKANFAPWLAVKGTAVTSEFPIVVHQQLKHSSGAKYECRALLLQMNASTFAAFLHRPPPPRTTTANSAVSRPFPIDLFRQAPSRAQHSDDSPTSASARRAPWLLRVWISDGRGAVQLQQGASPPAGFIKASNLEGAAWAVQSRSSCPPELYTEKEISNLEEFAFRDMNDAPMSLDLHPMPDRYGKPRAVPDQSPGFIQLSFQMQYSLIAAAREFQEKLSFWQAPAPLHFSDANICNRLEITCRQTALQHAYFLGLTVLQKTEDFQPSSHLLYTLRHAPVALLSNGAPIEFSLPGQCPCGCESQPDQILQTLSHQAIHSTCISLDASSHSSTSSSFPSSDAYARMVRSSLAFRNSIHSVTAPTSTVDAPTVFYLADRMHEVLTDITAEVNRTRPSTRGDRPVTESSASPCGQCALCPACPMCCSHESTQAPRSCTLVESRRDFNCPLCLRDHHSWQDLARHLNLEHPLFRFLFHSCHPAPNLAINSLHPRPVPYVDHAHCVLMSFSPPLELQATSTSNCDVLPGELSTSIDFLQPVLPCADKTNQSAEFEGFIDDEALSGSIVSVADRPSDDMPTASFQFTTVAPNSRNQPIVAELPSIAEWERKTDQMLIVWRDACVDALVAHRAHAQAVSNKKQQVALLQSSAYARLSESAVALHLPVAKPAKAETPSIPVDSAAEMQRRQLAALEKSRRVEYAIVHSGYHRGARPPASKANVEMESSSELSVLQSGDGKKRLSTGGDRDPKRMKMLEPAVQSFQTLQPSLSASEASSKLRLLARIQAQTFFHASTLLPMRPLDLLVSPSPPADADQVDWWRETARARLIDEFVDLSLAERTLMKAWSAFCASKRQHSLSDAAVPSACLEFSRLCGADLIRCHLRHALLSHLLALVEFGVLQYSHIVECMRAADAAFSLQFPAGSEGPLLDFFDTPSGRSLTHRGGSTASTPRLSWLARVLTRSEFEQLCEADVELS